MISRRIVAARLGWLMGLPLLPRSGHAGGTSAATGPTLLRGINLSSWFGSEPTRQPLTAADFRQIKAAGFDHVRIPARPEGFGYDPRPDGGSLTLSFPAVDAAIAMALANGLAVDVNLQLQRDHKTLIEDDDRAADRYVALTAAVARRLAGYPVERVAFEPVNEFGFYRDADKFARFQTRVWKAVRAELPHSTIILGGPMGSGLKGLEKVVPVADDNAVYAFHFYEPYMITHQGVSWGFKGMAIHWFRGVPYPSNLVKSGVDYAPAAPDRVQADAELATYVDGHWDRNRIAARIQVAVEWAKRNRTRVICNEFGVLRLHIDPGSRYRWIADTRAALEADGIGWSLWDYADIFGITDPAAPISMAAAGAPGSVQSDGTARSFEAAALQALFPG